MAKTIANLRVGVRMYLDESQAVDFTDIEVDREINYAYHDLITKVMEVYEEFYNTVTPKNYSTVANQQEYTLDTTLLKIERVEINYQPTDPNSQALRATAIKMNELPLNLSNPNVGGGGLFNAGYYVNGKQSSQKIGFVPIPTTSGTNNITVWGTEAPSDLSDANTSVDIPYPDRFAKLIEQKAAAELLKKGQQEVAAANDLIREYQIGVLDMQTFLKERQADGPQMITEVAYDDVDVSTPL